MPRWLIDSLATGGPALVVADAVSQSHDPVVPDDGHRRGHAAIGGCGPASALEPDAVRLDRASVTVLVASRLATADSPCNGGAAR